MKRWLVCLHHRLFDRPGTTQAYYWTPAWQREERRAAVDLMSGRVQRFTDVHDAKAWLDQALRRP